MAEITGVKRDFVLGTDGVTYFEVVTTDFDNEEQTVVKRLIGPASTLVANQVNAIQSRFSTLARDADNVSRAKSLLNEAGGDAADIKTITGISPLDEIQALLLPKLTASGWTIDDGSGAVTLEFSTNAQGVLKYSIGGAATKNAIIYGGVIQLKNYPNASTNTEFYLSNSGRRFFSLPNRAVIIKAPGSINFR